MTALKKALKDLSDALGDHSDVAEPFDTLETAVGGIADSFGTLGAAADNLADALEALAKQGTIDDDLGDLIASIRALAE